MIPDLYEALSWTEAGVPGSGTFNSFPLLNGGVTTWVDLGLLTDPTVNFLLSLKGEIGGNPVDNAGLWTWASKYDATGITLYNIVRSNTSSAYHVKWPIVVMASGNPAMYTRNYIAVDDYLGEYAKLAGIPMMDDYSDLTLDFLFQNGYGGAAYTMPGGMRLSSNGILFFVPYFSGGFNTSKGFDGSLWISTKYLGNKIGQAAPFPVPPPTSTPVPSPTPTPPPTPTPVPSPTPLPTPAPVPSPTPLPTPTPAPSPAPQPTPTPTPGCILGAVTKIKRLFKN